MPHIVGLDRRRSDGRPNVPHKPIKRVVWGGGQLKGICPPNGAFARNRAGGATFFHELTKLNSSKWSFLDLFSILTPKMHLVKCEKLMSCNNLGSHAN